MSHLPLVKQTGDGAYNSVAEKRILHPRVSFTTGTVGCWKRQRGNSVPEQPPAGSSPQRRGMLGDRILLSGGGRPCFSGFSAPAFGERNQQQWNHGVPDCSVSPGARVTRPELQQTQQKSSPPQRWLLVQGPQSGNHCAGHSLGDAGTGGPLGRL